MYVKKSLKKNLFSRSFFSFVELAFSLFSFPYIARIFTPEILGEIDFANSTVAYFVVLGGFGIAEYGAREVALLRELGGGLSQSLSKLFGMGIAIRLGVFCAYLMLVVPFFGNGSLLFWLSSLVILTSGLNLSWALESLEDFGFLAKARFFSKLLFFIFLIFFIKEPDDFYLYFTGVIFFDFLYFFLTYIRLSEKFDVSFYFSDLKESFKALDIYSIFKVFVLVLVQSSIFGIPSLFLGRLQLFEELGYYSVAQRFFWIGYYAFMPLSAVLLSRSLGLFSESTTKEDRGAHLDKSASSLFLLCFPLAFGLAAVSNDLVPLLAGDQYQKSVGLLKILSPVIVLFATTNFWSMQVIFSSKGDSVLLKTGLVGLGTMIISSSILIPMYYEHGAATSVLLTSSVMTLLYYLFGRSLYSIKGVMPEVIKSLMASLIMFVSIYSFSAETPVFLACKVGLGVSIYFVTLLVVRHRLLMIAIRKSFMR